MPRSEVLNQVRFFVAALEGHRDPGERAAFMRITMQRLFNALGETAAPKIKAVPLPADDNTVRLGLYTIKQGRRPGRNRNRPGSRWIGGLVVDAAVAPAVGLFEYSPDLDQAPPEAPSFSTPVERIVRTDGQCWQILDRDMVTGAFPVSGEFILPTFDHGLEWAMPRPAEALFDTPQVLCGFVEFLRRALVPGHDPDALAKQAASYGRELVHWLMAAEDAPRLERFAIELRERYSLYFSTLTPEWQAAKVMAYGLLLDTIMASWAPEYEIRNAGEGGIDWHAVADLEGQAIPAKILDEVSARFRRFFPWPEMTAKDETGDLVDEIDEAALDFCSTVWRELSGRDTAAESFTPAARELDRDWIDGFLSAVADPHGNHKSSPTPIVLGDDVGTCAVRAMTAASGRFGTAIVLAAASDPVAYQAMKFRLSRCRRMLGMRKGDADYQSVFGLPSAFDSFGLSLRRDTVLCCDFLRRFPSGVKETSPDEAFAECFDHALNWVREYKSGPATFRLPADFLDAKEYAEPRRQLFDTGRPLWIRYDESQERPRDKRLARAFATVILDSAEGHSINPPDGYEKLRAAPELRFSLLPPRLCGGFRNWPALPELAAVPPLNGPVERRGMTLIDLDRDALAARVSEYFSYEVSDEYIAANYPDMMKDGPRFNAKLSRRKIRDKTFFTSDHLTPYPFRPFDRRFAYLRDMRPLFSDPAADLHAIATIPGNWFLVASEGDAGAVGGPPAWASREPCDYDFFVGRSRHIPVLVPEALLDGQKIRLEHGRWYHPEELSPQPNLSPEAKAYLERLGYSDPDRDGKCAADFWHYVLAVLYTPAYAATNRDVLRLGWPRVPFPEWKVRRPSPEARRAFQLGAEWGERIRGILSGDDLDLLRIIPEVASLRRTSDDDPVSSDRLTEAERTVTAPWGMPAKGRAVRAQRGDVRERPYGARLSGRIVALARAMGLDAGECLHRLGDEAVDVHLNEETYWTGIPKAAWEYTIGGRSILGKWLSYRDARVLARPMTPTELNHFADTARHLTVLALIGISLDELWPKITGLAGKSS